MFFIVFFIALFIVCDIDLRYWFR